MKKEWKDKWIEALRSGKYKQGEGYLRTNKDEFCCLGVLCDIVDPSGWSDKMETSHDIKYYLDEGFVLPESVAKVTGLESFIDQDDLSLMNDDGFSFKEIASWIEENV